MNKILKIINLGLVAINSAVGPCVFISSLNVVARSANALILYLQGNVGALVSYFEEESCMINVSGKNIMTDRFQTFALTIFIFLFFIMDISSFFDLPEFTTSIIHIVLLCAEFTFCIIVYYKFSKRKKYDKVFLGGPCLFSVLNLIFTILNFPHPALRCLSFSLFVGNSIFCILLLANLLWTWLIYKVSEL